jgi:predicted transcriptional regulator
MKRLLAFLLTSRWRGAAALVEAQKLRDLCAALYQVCGALDARTDVLDALSDASVGNYTGDPLSLLPYPPSEAWLFKNEKAHASVMRGLEQAQRGEFADPPGLGEDETFAAMIPDESDKLTTKDGFVAVVSELAVTTRQSKAEVLRNAVNCYHKYVWDLIEQAVQSEIKSCHKEKRSAPPFG